MKTFTIEDIKRRNKIITKINEDKDFALSCIALYSKDINFFCNDLCMTEDTRLDQSFRVLPFITFKRQEDFFNYFQECYENQKSGIVLKSRDSGLSWLCCVIAVHSFLFKENESFTFGSHKAVSVDNLGDMGSLLEKCRFLLRYMPKHLLRGFMEEKHSKYMLLKHPFTRSSIKGDSGDNMGRGGRSTVYFKDESAHYERAEQIDAAISANSNVIIDISTPKGFGNLFHRKCMNHGDVFIFKYSDDPRKTKEYMEKKKLEIGDPVIFAQEYECNFGDSLERVVCKFDWVNDAVNLDIEGIDNGNVRCGFDVADNGRNAVTIAKGNKVIHIEIWENMEPYQTVKKLLNMCQEKDVEVINYEHIGIGASTGAIMKKIIKERKYKVELNGISTGSPPLGKKLFESKQNKDVFKNIRALMWWNLRLRFLNVFNYKKDGVLKDIDMLISIPDHKDLKIELSNIQYDQTDSGLFKIESKESLRRRGIRSPDIADSLALCFMPRQKIYASVSKYVII